MTQATTTTPTYRRAAPPPSAFNVTRAQRFWRYFNCIAAAYLTVNLFFAYRFDAPFLLLNQLFDVTGLVQQNPVGLSLLELAIYDLQLAYWAIAGQSPLLGIIAVGIAIGLALWANLVIRTIWLSFRSFNRGWLIGQGLFKALIIGGVVTLIMLGIAQLRGQGFQPLTIIEVALWLLPGWFGAVVARGLLWNTDNLRDANLRAVNQTVSDPVQVDNGHHHHDDGMPLPGQDDLQ